MSNLSLVTFAADKMETSMRLTDSACAGSARQVNNPLVGLEDINKYTDNMIGLEIRKGLEVVKLLGQGVSRAGFETSHGTVIKIPKTANGARENILESYLLSAMLPTMRTTPIICRHRLFGMPVLEVEKLDELSNNPGDRKAVAGSQYKELALVARKGFGLTDWLQIGFSKRFNRWVLNDVAPPWGAANKQADPLDLKWALHRDVCDEQEHYNCKGV